MPFRHLCVRAGRLPLTDHGRGRDRRQAGVMPMFRQIACCWVRLVAAMLVSAAVALSPAAAQQSSSNDPSELEAIRLLLDRIEVTLRREGLSVQALYDLGQTLNPARDELRG